MKDFSINIELEDNILYISEEGCSGCEYEVESKADILEEISIYIDDYIEEEKAEPVEVYMVELRDYNDFYDCVTFTTRHICNDKESAIRLGKEVLKTMYKCDDEDIVVKGDDELYYKEYNDDGTAVFITKRILE